MRFDSNIPPYNQLFMNQVDTNQQDLLLRLIKVYIVEYLSTVHGIKCFQQEAINMLALYIVRTIKEVCLQTKRTTGLQGRTIPNCLHLVDTLEQNNIVRPIKLISFLNAQRNRTSKNIKLSYSGLQMLGKTIFEDDAETTNEYQRDMEFGNIRYVPFEYTYDPKENPLHMKAPLDQAFRKPLDFTYKVTTERVEKEEKNVEQLSNYSNREMRRSLGILSAQDRQQYLEKPRKIQVSNQNVPRPVPGKGNKFSMIEFI